MQPIRQVAVIGAGVMGAGIAAQIANAGIPVFLYEKEQKILDRALEGLRTRSPAALMDPSSLDLIKPVLVADWQPLQQCDWVIEVIVEDLEAKTRLYDQIEPYLPSNCLLSSNTSGILLRELVAERSESFKSRFAITHFFNPPRYMQLLEFVRGQHTSTETVARLVDCCERQLGKTVVEANDTPGFIANRIGIFSILNGIQIALKNNIKIEEVDAITGRPLGMPKTGVFGLADLIGLDTIALIARNFRSQLPKEDYAQQILGMPDLVEIMLRKGWIGRKGPGGFYRITREQGGKISETITAEGGYRETDFGAQSLFRPMNFERLLEDTGAHGQFAWDFLSGLIVYTLEIAQQIAESPLAIDTAMRLGYNWRWGPFELLDKIGVQRFAEYLQREKRSLPPLLVQMLEPQPRSSYRLGAQAIELLSFKGQYQSIPRASEQLHLQDLKAGQSPIVKTESGALWSMGEGVGCVEFCTKLNILDGGVVELLDQVLDRAASELQALVIGGDGAHICAGADLNFFLRCAVAERWSEVESFLAALQHTFARLRYANFPVVAAAKGLALGGGCEMLMHCHARVAHAELNAGLVEAGVGLLPAGGGLKALCLHWQQHELAEHAIGEQFANLIFGTVSASALQARRFGYLQAQDPIEMHVNRVLAGAKNHAQDLAKGFEPLKPGTLQFDGVARYQALQQQAEQLHEMGQLSEVDYGIAIAMANVVSANQSQTTVTEAEMEGLEREYFIELLKRTSTQDRIKHMLATGQRLQN